MKKCIGWIITTMLLPFVLAGFIYQLAEYAFIFGKQMDAAYLSYKAATEEANKRIAELEKLSVTNIMVSVVPGYDGQGEEVFAKSVSEVEKLISDAYVSVDELESEVAESDFVIKQTTTLLAEICLILKGEPPALTRFGYHDLPKMVRELQANNNTLRKDLGKILVGYADKYLVEQTATEALSTTPAESLQAHDNEVIEKCAIAAANACLVPPDGGSPMKYEVELCDAIAEVIRALKGK